MSYSTAQKLALVRLIPVYPSMVRMKDLRKVLNTSGSILLNMLYNLEGVAEQGRALCFITLEAKEKAQKKYAHMLAECRQKDNGGAL